MQAPKEKEVGRDNEQMGGNEVSHAPPILAIAVIDNARSGVLKSENIRTIKDGSLSKIGSAGKSRVLFGVFQDGQNHGIDCLE